MLTEKVRILKSSSFLPINKHKEQMVQQSLVILVEELVISKETAMPEEDQLKPLEREHHWSYFSY